jgi:hypothetical protein
VAEKKLTRAELLAGATESVDVAESHVAQALNALRQVEQGRQRHVERVLEDVQLQLSRAWAALMVAADTAAKKGE